MAETIDFKKAKASGNERKQASDKISDFVANRRIALIAVAVVVIVAIVAYVAFASVSSKKRANALAEIENATYELTNESAYLEEDEIATRKSAAMEIIAKYLGSSGIVGVRANMLAAEIEFSGKNYAEALKYWETANSKSGGSYITSLSYFNMAVCNEELGDLENAVSNYEKAASDADFAFVSHALFSAARVKETLEDFSGAYNTYQKLVDTNPNDDWASLARSRKIALETEGKISGK